MKMDWVTSELQLSQGVFVMIDALGRTFPMHLQFVNSWEVFDAAMEAHFRNVKGHRKIMDKEFALQNRGTGLELSRSRPWEGVLKPGQRVDMEMIFSSTGTVAPPDRQCPGCMQYAPETTSRVCEWYNLTTFTQRMSRLLIYMPPARRADCDLPPSPRHTNTKYKTTVRGRTQAQLIARHL